MSQKTKIFSFLLKNPNLRPIEISKALKLKKGSVNSAISRLRKDGILTKPKKNHTVRVKSLQNNIVNQFLKKIQRKTKEVEKKIPKIEYFTKILKTGGSNKHDKKIVASTYETQENPERFQELKKAIMDFANLYRLQTRDLGYQRKRVLSEPVKIPEFPEIEVHTEF